MRVIEGLFTHRTHFPRDVLKTREEHDAAFAEGFAVRRKCLAVWSIESAEVTTFDFCVGEGHDLTWFTRDFVEIITKGGQQHVLVRGPSYEEICALMRECS